MNTSFGNGNDNGNGVTGYYECIDIDIWNGGFSTI